MGRRQVRGLGVPLVIADGRLEAGLLLAEFVLVQFADPEQENGSPAIHLERLLVPLDRVLELALSQSRRREADHGVHVVGLNVEDGRELLFGVRVVQEVDVDGAEVHPRLDVALVEPDRSREVLHRPRQVLLDDENAAEVRVGLDRVGIQREHLLLEDPPREVDLSRLQEDETACVQRRDVLRLDGQDLLDELLGLARLVPQQPEQRQRVVRRDVLVVARDDAVEEGLALPHQLLRLGGLAEVEELLGVGEVDLPDEGLRVRALRVRLEGPLVGLEGQPRLPLTLVGHRDVEVRLQELLLQRDGLLELNEGLFVLRGHFVSQLYAAAEVVLSLVLDPLDVLGGLHLGLMEDGLEVLFLLGVIDGDLDLRAIRLDDDLGLGSTPDGEAERDTEQHDSSHCALHVGLLFLRVLGGLLEHVDDHVPTLERPDEVRR